MFNAPDHPIIRQLEKYGVLEEYADKNMVTVCTYERSIYER